MIHFEILTFLPHHNLIFIYFSEYFSGYCAIVPCYCSSICHLTHFCSFSSYNNDISLFCYNKSGTDGIHSRWNDPKSFSLFSFDSERYFLDNLEAIFCIIIIFRQDNDITESIYYPSHLWSFCRISITRRPKHGNKPLYPLSLFECFKGISETIFSMSIINKNSKTPVVFDFLQPSWNHFYPLNSIDNSGDIYFL